MIKKLILTILASISCMPWAQEQRTQKSIDSLKNMNCLLLKTDTAPTVKAQNLMFNYLLTDLIK